MGGNSENGARDCNLKCSPLRRFKHPNVITFRKAFLTHSHVGLAMEFAPYGTLFEKVKREGGLPVRLKAE